MTDEEDKAAIVNDALAEYLGIEVEELRGWVIGVERMTPEGVSFSSIWSSNTPIWGLLGFCEELKLHLNQNRPVESPNGVTPSRAARRGRGSRRR